MEVIETDGGSTAHIPDAPTAAFDELGTSTHPLSPICIARRFRFGIETLMRS